ncbi:FtsH protease activity modulator HflK [Oharaeibacter diazotrophicus]|uniref:Protein HflK n=1 Tax=Oharaeibacter diazotrophicus TaxID=1920512 RepID=A0A4R6RGT1_9HYPH|nr:FtsH protease activity modulator HflK [Oharaeibacter diazotrophicus]TDP85573.1 protease FtsH subunit HflK [Oharaeibacter diazotrophicus]BBE74544.1 modulator of FtsH protease HflK [Pleomorphomonas sp. SM30]GLS75757.1 protease modulator HflK [Oharaeibacter diazotrophicus]
MPWSNQSGGGWKGGGNGPWGQPPRGGGGGGGGNNPPDLEELLRRSQDKLRRLLPGGSRGPGGPGGQGGARLFAPLVLAVVGAFWIYECVYVVQPDEVGVELRFGEVKPEINEPGIHFMFWPIESVEKPPLRKENQENIGSAARATSDGSIMLSGDQNLVNVEFSVLWQIDDPIKYLFNIADQQNLVRVVSESAMREYVGRTRADEFRTTGRDAAQVAVAQLIQSTLNTYQAGVRVKGVNVTRADPPREVSDAFGEVQRAQQDQDKVKQDAQAYANKRLGDARGEASQIRENAIGYRDRVIAEATGAAQRFRDVYEQYAKAPEVIRKRIYLETMEGVLSKSDKVILGENAGNGVVPYLPLPELRRGAAAAAAAQGTTTEGEVR